MLTRRTLGTMLLSLVALAPHRALASFEITLYKAEWKKRLTPAQFAVLREHATEAPFTSSLLGEVSPLLKEKRRGTYNCACCGLPAYSSKAKYDSGTGWPILLGQSVQTPSERPKTTPFLRHGSKYIAAGVAAILVTFSMMVPSQQASATASTVWR